MGRNSELEFNDKIGRDLEEISVPITKSMSLLMMMSTFIIGTITAAVILYMTINIIYSDVRGKLMVSEKILLLSVTIPDMTLVAYNLFLVLPMTYKNKWEYGTKATSWLGMVHLVGLFHPSIAIGCICNLVALNYTEEHRYEIVNKNGPMSILCVAYFAITICFCSLSSIESGGLIYNPYWFAPLLTIYKGVGGILTVSVLTAVSVFHQLASLRDLLMTQRQFKELKMGKKDKDELSSHINFVGLNLTITVVTALATIAPVMKMRSLELALIFRMIVHITPIWRVILLTRSCPHFKFVVEEAEEDLMEFAQLGKHRKSQRFKD